MHNAQGDFAVEKCISVHLSVRHTFGIASKRLSSVQGFIQPSHRGGETGWRTPPETNTPPGQGPSTPPQGSTCFDDQLTRSLHTNLLLQHETEGIHTTKKLKYM